MIHLEISPPRVINLFPNSLRILYRLREVNLASLKLIFLIVSDKVENNLFKINSSENAQTNKVQVQSIKQAHLMVTDDMIL